MTEKYFPSGLKQAKGKKQKLTEEADKCMQEFRFNDALDKIWATINTANKSIEDTKPWALAKEKRLKELEVFIRGLIETLKAVAENLTPFMPETADKILTQVTAKPIKKGKPLFPRIVM